MAFHRELVLAMTYNACTGRFDQLARNAEQTMALI
jgi:hypothetical protein